MHGYGPTTIYLNRMIQFHLEPHIHFSNIRVRLKKNHGRYIF